MPISQRQLVLLALGAAFADSPALWCAHVPASNLRRKEPVARRPELVYAPASIAARSAWQTTRTIPPPSDQVVKLKAAKALGITIPQSFLLRADRVIE